MSHASLPIKRTEFVEGAVGRIECTLEQQAEAASFVALICHPHPLQGGSKENKVVTTLSRTCRQAGAAVLRFNFRGVGQSEGQFDGGMGEAEDTVLLARWLRQQFPGLPLWLAGFSFGSFVAARAAALLADEAPVAHLLLVAPPVHHYDFDAIHHTGCGVTVIQGEVDEVVPPEEVYQWVRQSVLNPAIIRFPGCSHFFHGFLPELMQATASCLPPGQG